MKRIVSLVLALSMVMSMFTFSFAGTELTDIAGTEYEAAVEALVELGIVSGYPDKTYLPEEKVTRAQMAKLLVIAAGLERAAQVSVGATKFNDVPANHWACGYINVASEYGYIVGYGDGNFGPDATVTYSQAVTMVIRALGYTTVVEAKGTWPTNYINKAEQLNVLDDVEYKTYDDGATRGNVALLIWNMLRTYMWDVTGENESAGLDYSDKGEVTMIDKYFEKYTYTTVDFEDFRIEDGEIIVTLDDNDVAEDKAALKDKAGEYTYADADFYTFVPGTEVEVLVNEKEGTLLMMVPNGEDKLVEGTVADLTDEDGLDYDFSGEAPEVDYVYGILDDEVICDDYRTLEVTSEYVYEVKEKADKWFKYNKHDRFEYDDDEDTETIFIVDGEFGSFDDIKEGDVVSFVTCDNRATFYIVDGSKVEGRLNAYVANDYTMEIGKEELTVADNAVYVVDPKDEDEIAGADLKTARVHLDMKNEDVVAHLDFLNRVVRVEFDGELGDDDEEETSFGFYAIKTWVEKASARVYEVDLENEDGKATYKFAYETAENRALVADIMEYQEENDIRNIFYYVEFNEDGEIVDIAPLTDGASYPADAEAGDDVTFVGALSGEDYNEDNAVFTVTGCAEFSKIKVSKDTVIVTPVEDKDEEGKLVDVLFETGAELLDDLADDENVYVVYVYNDEKTVNPTAKYVVLEDAVNAKSDDIFALITKLENDDVYETTIVLEDEDGDETTIRGVELDLSDFAEGMLVKFETEEDDDELKLSSIELVVDPADTHNWAATVTLVDGTEAKLDLPGDLEDLAIDLADEDTLEMYEEYRVVVVNYVEEGENEYEISSFEEIKVSDVSFVEDDLFLDNGYNVTPNGGQGKGDLMIIITGYEAPEQ